MKQDDLKKIAKECFENCPNLDTIYGCEDGNMFHNESDAKEHNKRFKSEVVTYTRKMFAKTSKNESSSQVSE